MLSFLYLYPVAFCFLMFVSCQQIPENKILYKFLIQQQQQHRQLKKQPSKVAFTVKIRNPAQ